MPRVSDEHLRRRREQILRSATDLFIEQGLYAVSMNDLVDASGLSIGAIYRYFDSKQALVQAVCEDLLVARVGALSRLGSTRAALISMLDFAERNPLGQLITQIWGEAPFRPELQGVLARSHEVLVRELADLIEADRTTQRTARLEARDAAVVILAAVEGYRDRSRANIQVSRLAFLRGLEPILISAGV